MTREELKGKQTPGVAEVYADFNVRIEGSGRSLCSAGGYFNNKDGGAHYDQNIANAALYAEAHNVANRTGMWPEDLVARVKELEGALSRARAYVHQSQLDTAMGWTGDYEAGLRHASNYFLVREIDATLNKPTP